MPYLRLEDILRPTTTPEQANFLNEFYTKFNSGIAANKKIINVEPLFYQGLYPGTEFLVYNANKLYICLNYQSAGHYVYAAVPDFPLVFYYDENNVVSFVGAYVNTYNSTQYGRNPFVVNNFYFSRVQALVYSSFIFNGYRITLV